MSGHGAETPQPIPMRGNAKALAARGLVILVLVIGSVWWKLSPKPTPPPTTTYAAGNAGAQNPAPPLKEVEIFREGCWTPCSINISYKAKIRREGVPIRIKFQDVPEWVHFPIVDENGGESPKPPANATSGDTKFASDDPKKERTWVEVYEVITVRLDGR